MRIIVLEHYLHRKAPCSFAFGLFKVNDSNPTPRLSENYDLFQYNKIYGVVTYGTPSSSSLRAGICGLEEKNNVIELTRLWVDDIVPKNGESFLIGNTLKKVNKEIIVSYAEIDQGHIGIIYQATNWVYTGLSAKRTNWQLGNNNKHSQTIADKYTSKQLKEIYGEKFNLVKRPPKHRYIYFNCSKTRKKYLIKKLKYRILDYPKIDLFKK